MRPRTAALAVLLLAAACGQQSASADVDAARAWIDGYLDAVGTRVDAAGPTSRTRSASMTSGWA